MQVLRVKEVASRLAVTTATVWRWARATDFPKPFTLCGTTVWDEEEINRWLQSQKEKRHGSNGEAESGNLATVV